jgi:DNA-binding GntR family transcriptional regulator
MPIVQDDTNSLAGMSSARSGSTGGAPNVPAAAARTEETLADRVRLELRRQLLSASFPVWERLTEARLATHLGVSRTPVREALRQLEREELVVVDENGSYRPRVPVVTHIQNLYAVRAQLEEMSVTLACGPNRDEARLADLAKQWKAIAVDDELDPEYVYVEESFHLGLAEVGGNTALVEVLASINDRIRLARSFSFNDPDKRGFSVRGHRQIIRIVQQRDAELARTRIREHITDSAAMVEESVKQALVLMHRAG